MLKVTNKSEIDLSDRFNGQDYSFPKGKTVSISEDAARHIFGFGDAEKVSYLVRLGWMKTNAEYDVAMRLMGGFVFSVGAEPMDGEIQQEGQGLAPLQFGAAEEAGSDGSVESAVPIPPAKRGKGRSVLAQLSGG
jgi:hypothetical protein